MEKTKKAHSEGGGRGGRRKTAAASNEERNFKQEMLAAMATIGYVLANPSYKNYLQRLTAYCKTWSGVEWSGFVKHGVDL